MVVELSGCAVLSVLPEVLSGLLLLVGVVLDGTGVVVSTVIPAVFGLAVFGWLVDVWVVVWAVI